MTHFSPCSASERQDLSFHLCRAFTHIYTSGPRLSSDPLRQIKQTTVSKGTCLVSALCVSVWTLPLRVIKTHITPVDSNQSLCYFLSMCWCSGALLCLTLSRITSRLLQLKSTSTSECHNAVSSSKTTNCNHAVHIHGVYVYYIHTTERSDFSRPLPPVARIANLTHGFPFTLLADIEFLFRFSKDDRRLQSLGCRGEV